ncbi:hypothetical protein C8Q76DRAFT_694784 [Earliella scabrosa]|nr:hypothetical protein C8Q76DRAFT_694784 [Earliella scabrosa]
MTSLLPYGPQGRRAAGDLLPLSRQPREAVAMCDNADRLQFLDLSGAIANQAGWSATRRAVAKSQRHVAGCARISSSPEIEGVACAVIPEPHARSYTSSSAMISPVPTSCMFGHGEPRIPVGDLAYGPYQSELLVSYPLGRSFQCIRKRQVRTGRLASSKVTWYKYYAYFCGGRHERYSPEASMYRQTVLPILPAELWVLIITLTPRRWRSSWLLLSRFFYKLALPILFKSLTITYGTPGGYDPSMLTKASILAEVRQMYRNEALLRYIAVNPTFSRVIRELFVCWYDDSYTEGLYSRQLGVVTSALLALPELRVFCWAGESCRGTPDLLGAISATAAKLERVRVPVAFLGPEISGLRALSSIAAWNEPPYGNPAQPLPPPASSRALLDLIDGNASSLRVLKMTGDAVWTHQLPQLWHLSLDHTVNLPALQLVLPLNNLTALRLMVQEAGIPSAISALATDPSVCPALVDFKLICESSVDRHWAVTMTPVARFLRNKTNLQRLHVVFYLKQRVCDEPFLEVLPYLPSLRVLGFEMTREQLTKPELQRYDEALPEELTDLLLYTEFDTVDAGRNAVLDMLRKRRKLRTLHVVDTSEAETFDLAPLLVPAMRITEAPSTPPVLPGLELYGSGSAVFPICRGSPSLCSLPQHWHVDVESAGWTDWYWLLEYDSVFENVHRYACSPATDSANGTEYEDGTGKRVDILMGPTDESDGSDVGWPHGVDLDETLYRGPRIIHSYGYDSRKVYYWYTKSHCRYLLSYITSASGPRVFAVKEWDEWGPDNTRFVQFADPNDTMCAGHWHSHYVLLRELTGMLLNFADPSRALAFCARRCNDPVPYPDQCQLVTEPERIDAGKLFREPVVSTLPYTLSIRSDFLVDSRFTSFKLDRERLVASTRYSTSDGDQDHLKVYVF